MMNVREFPTLPATIALALACVLLGACSSSRGGGGGECSSNEECTDAALSICSDSVCVECVANADCDCNSVCSDNNCVPLGIRADLLGLDNDDPLPPAERAHGVWEGTPDTDSYRLVDSEAPFCETDADCNFGQICSSLTRSCFFSADYQTACTDAQSPCPNGLVCDPRHSICLPGAACVDQRNCCGVTGITCQQTSTGGQCLGSSTDGAECTPPDTIKSQCPFSPREAGGCGGTDFCNASGRCVQCACDDDCDATTGRGICNFTTGHCAGCVENSDCDTGEVCDSDSGSCTTPCTEGSCPSGEFCETETGVCLTGAPDIEVEYTGYRGPELDVDCSGTICTTAPLNMGNVGLGATGSARVVIRNKAACGGSSGSATPIPCGRCALELNTELDSTTNVGGLFAIEGVASGTIPQRDLDCGNEGEARILVRFDAPITEGLHETKIILISNDPDERRVEIPLQATALNAPIAVAKFAPQSASGDGFQPLGRVYLDGSDSYDPEDPTDPTLIAQYIWEVIEYPAGLTPSDFDITGQGTPNFNMFIPTVGTYRVRLIVTNISGVQSGDTDESFVEFDAAPSSRLYVQLTWDHPTNDQDLHLVYESGGGGVCTDNDCHYSNCNAEDFDRPVWHSSSPPGEGANPTLVIDDTNGFGPEAISIDDPEPGTYRIYVHNYSNSNASNDEGPTRNAIRVLMDGIPVAEFRRRLVNHDLWAVADIVWSESGGTVQPLPTDSPNTGVFGQIRTMSPAQCAGGGFDF